MRYSITQLSLLYIIMWIMPLSGSAQVQALIPAASQWHYYDKVTAPNKNWHKPPTDHRLWQRSWQSGFAQFGYGEGDETTVTSFGKDSTDKPLSQYFVKTFTVSDITQIDALKLHLLIDDGAIVYLNGQEVFRLHVPANPADPQQNLAANHSLAANDSLIESIWIETPLDKSALKQGENFIAVEVHQIAADSSDLSFDLALIYSPLQQIPLGENIQPTQLTANQAVSLSMTETKTFSQQYTIVLDEGVTELNINTSGGSGDADLYVGINKSPTLSQYTHRSAHRGNNETLSYQSPAAGTYYIRLYSYRAFANTQLKVQLSND